MIYAKYDEITAINELLILEDFGSIKHPAKSVPISNMIAGFENVYWKEIFFKKMT